MPAHRLKALKQRLAWGLPVLLALAGFLLLYEMRSYGLAGVSLLLALPLLAATTRLSCASVREAADKPSQAVLTPGP